MVDGLAARGVDTWLISHDSDRVELEERFRRCPDRLLLSPSLPGMARMFTAGEKLPDGLRNLAWAVTQLERQYAMAPRIRQLVREHAIDVVHQPIGIAPGIPSPLTNLGAPLVVGPLNGGLSMPPGFADRDPAMARAVQRARKPLGRLAHSVVRGKLQASVVFVANERTRDVLPTRAAVQSALMPESAVNLRDWEPKDHDQPAEGPVRFVYLGRLVAYKSADLLLESFADVARTVDARLELIGDGPLLPALQEQVTRLGLADHVVFGGWMSKTQAAQRLRSSDIYVLPTLREAGGTSVLEAMASGLPSVVADWGGPAEYVDTSVGIRVSVASRQRFVSDFAAAMIDLASDPQRRAAMGQAARTRVAEHYDWDVLIDSLLSTYRRLAQI